MQLKTLFLSSESTKSMRVIPTLPNIFTIGQLLVDFYIYNTLFFYFIVDMNYVILKQEIR